MNSTSGHTVILSPIGEVEPSWITCIAGGIRQAFRFETRTARLLTDISFAYDSKRNQYHSTPILDKLASACPKDALRVLAIADVDLFIPILTYVYGEAQLGGRCAILSTHRLQKSTPAAHPDQIILQRLAKEAVHELGHTFDLKHCQDPACIMHYCRGINDVDQKTDQLCRYCRTFLGDALRIL